MEKLYAKVRITDAAEAFDRDYLYFILPEQREIIKKGSIVAVPYGNSNKIRTAVVVGFEDSTDYPQIKPINDIMLYPVLPNEEMLSVCAFMSSRCFCTYGAALKCVLPAGQTMRTSVTYKSLDYDTSSLNDKGKFIWEYLFVNGEVNEKVLVEEFGEDVLLLLKSLSDMGAITKTVTATEAVNEKNAVYYKLSDSEDALIAAENIESLKSENQRKIVSFLSGGGTITANEAFEMFGAGKSVFTSLTKSGIIEKVISREERSYLDYSESDEISPPPPLSSEQQKAFETISELMDSTEPKAALLYGVTGSGKTRVIIEACLKAVNNGKSSIVLVPEIGLTSQAVSAFRKIFGNKLFVFHSMLSAGEKLDTVRKIIETDVSVVIGTRSAVFAQVNNLGLIAVDEEQEHTYKSENTPKYHARDIARFRANYNKCLMLLSSATPSIESYYKAESGIYTLIKLENRFGNANLPECKIADIRGDKRISSGKLIGEELKKRIEHSIENNKQSILFMNRRGYNTHLSCMKCGYVFTCPNCSVSLTYHSSGIGDAVKKNKLVCHYCGYIMLKPQVCPVCGSEHIGFFGAGTQKLEEELQNDFPGAKTVRMDADTTNAKHSHEEIIKSFCENEYDILFGTQMISKGLDFPNVDLVGVVSADSNLYMNDFRAGERTFSLFTQLAGRSGRRDIKGDAIFQTMNPENEILKISMTQDYEKFYKSEIALRKAVLFPPFCDIAVFGFAAETENDAISASESMSGLIRNIYAEKYKDEGIPIIILGPYRESLFKLRNKYRQRIILKYRDVSASRRFLDDCYRSILKKLPKNVKGDIDINPPII